MQRGPVKKTKEMTAEMVQMTHENGRAYGDKTKIFEKEIVELTVAQMDLYAQQYIQACSMNLGA
jgi:hypothetical protein